MKIDIGTKVVIGLLVASATCFIVAGAMGPGPEAKILASNEQLQKEVTFLRDANYSLHEKQAGLQYRSDMLQLYLWQYSTGEITKEEMGSKIESMGPRSKLLKIEKHKLGWE